MRPKYPQDHLLQPLDQILGTRANVRLLRALALSAVSLTSGELARRARLGRTSIYPALRELEHTGVTEFMGAGAQRQVQLRERHPLVRALKELFHAEARRFEELIAALRELFVDLPVRPLSAWADARPHGAEGEGTLALYFIAAPEQLEALQDHLDAHLARVERAYDVHVTVKGLTRSELDTLSGTQGKTLVEAVLLDGVPPGSLLSPSRQRATSSIVTSHEEHDARSRRLALAVATKIKRDPGLIALAEERIRRRALKASPGERRELTEWMRVLSTMSSARLRRFLVEDSERATRLRQSLPALNLLSPTERDAVVQSHTDAEVVSAMTKA